MNEKSKTGKPILCLDFDGVLHSYASGWKGADVVPDPPVPGAIAFLREAVRHFRVAIFSSRSNQPGGLTAMHEWVGYWSVAERLSDDEELSWCGELEWPAEKPPALVMIDDRALTFTGAWPSMDELKNFRPWNKMPAGVEKLVLQKCPAAWRVGPFPDGWALYADEGEARARADGDQSLKIEGLYARDFSS